MNRSKTYWCPNGCGKRVQTYTFIKENNEFQTIKYMCRTCKHNWTKDQIIIYHKS